MPSAQWLELNYPELNYKDWRETCQTLHRWMQIVGKAKLSKSPWTNHSWDAVLYMTERGLTTGVIHDESVSFAMDFDFLRHELEIRRSDGRQVLLSLHSETVSSFYGKCLGALRDIGINAVFSDRPNELPDDTPFWQDHSHASYDPVCVERFMRILLRCDRVMKVFRSRFTGKSSPVHFFWGSFDMAVTRFSGKRAPEHPGGVPHLPDLVTREAYSHEVSSCGFWPGNDLHPMAAFYSYAYPKPEGYELAQTVQGAYFDSKLREFILPYDVVRSAENPDQLVLDFFQKTYEAAANLGGWDRKLLEESAYLAEIHAQIARRGAAKAPSAPLEKKVA